MEQKHPPPDRPLPPTPQKPTTSPNKPLPKKPVKYTLAGTQDWQSMQKSRPITTFSLREREFINEALTAEVDPDLSGTKVIYVAPESDLSSLMSEDEDDGPTEGPGRLKKWGKKLYPAKMVAGAKVAGVAIRHPMVTSRKVNVFRGKKNSREAVSARASFSVTDLRADAVAGLKRSATVREAKDNGGSRKGILRRRRNSAPLLHEEAEIEVEIDNDLVPDSVKDTEGPKSAASVRTRRASLSFIPHRDIADMLGLSSPIQNRPSPIILTPRSLSFLPPPTPRQESSFDTEPEHQDIRLKDLEDEILSFTIESASTVSESGSQTGPSRPRVSILRFAKAPQTITPPESPDKEFTDAEYAYIEFVLDNLYDIILATALDQSGVQYRNTFAWRYLTENRNEFDKSIGYRFSTGGKRFKIRDYVGRFDFRGALLERLQKEESHRQLGLRWSEISFVDRRIKIELSYCLSDDESESENGE